MGVLRVDIEGEKRPLNERIPLGERNAMCMISRHSHKVVGAREKTHFK